MSAHTKIEWATHTFNPVWGCLRVSAGCQHCYAETWAKRTGFGNTWGPAANTPRRTFGDKHWAEPLTWDRDAAEAGVRERVFCGSMCDIAEDHPTTAVEVAKLWPLIRATPHLDWLLLTKRPERLRDVLPDDWGTGYPNVWLGTSVESQDVIRRVPALLGVPAVLHFLSCEPLLGPVTLRGNWFDYLEGWDTESEHDPFCNGECQHCPVAVQVRTNRIRWVIGGGESGAGARPCELAWLRSLRDQCVAADVAFLLKQLGGHPDKRGHDAAVLDGARHLAVPEGVP